MVFSDSWLGVTRSVSGDECDEALEFLHGYVDLSM